MSDDIGLNEAKPVITLHEWLTRLIDEFAEPARRELAIQAGVDQWRLRMCADPRHPDESWAEVIDNQRLVVMEFRNRPRSDDRVQRICEVPFRAMLVCGELWQDSKAKMAGRRV